MGFVGLGIRFEFGKVGGFDVGGLVVMNSVPWAWGISEAWEVVCNWAKCISTLIVHYNIVRVPAIEAVT